MIDKLSIQGLFGIEGQYDILFKDNSVIITGDNGNGKTTILDILYYTLVGDVQALFRYEFSSVIISFSKKFKFMNQIRVTKEYETDSTRLKYFYTYGRKNEVTMMSCEKPKFFEEVFIDLIGAKDDATFVYDDAPSLSKNETLLHIAKKNNLPIYTNIEKINQSILYFPTYRRLDIDLDDYFENYFHNPFRETSQANMFSIYDRRVVGISDRDVIKNLSAYSKKINEFTSENLDDLLKSFVKNFIDHIINEEQDSISIKVSDANNIQSIKKRLTDINQILDLNIENQRIDEFSNYYYRKNEESKEVIAELTDKGEEMDKDISTLLKFVNISNPWMSYLGILEKLYEEYQEKIKRQLRPYYFMEEQLSLFTNDKIKLKKMKNNEFNILKKEESIDFSKLSTGEKQLLTILVYTSLHLPEGNPSLIIIDEPEISLHVKWQRELLERIHEKKNISSIVATHSPFILDNKFRNTSITLVED